MTIACTTYADFSNISNSQLNTIGEKIFKNECMGQKKYLTHWNKGEDFASMGIGHFIWYPTETKGRFDESFPKLMTYYLQKNIALPSWLYPNKACPWKSQEDFYKNFNSRKMIFLRNLLNNTKNVQIEFIASRMQAALPKILINTSPAQKKNIEFQFNRMVESKGGLYPLIDYVNFKGEGILDTEKYNGNGWGLMQVLENMKGKTSGNDALNEFADSAISVLKRRVANAPDKTYEEKWLPAWISRVNTYRT